MCASGPAAAPLCCLVLPKTIGGCTTGRTTGPRGAARKQTLERAHLQRTRPPGTDRQAAGLSNERANRRGGRPGARRGALRAARLPPSWRLVLSAAVLVSRCSPMRRASSPMGTGDRWQHAWMAWPTAGGSHSGGAQATRRGGKTGTHAWRLARLCRGARGKRIADLRCSNLARHACLRESVLITALGHRSRHQTGRSTGPARAGQRRQRRARAGSLVARKCMKGMVTLLRRYECPKHRRSGVGGTPARRRSRPHREPAAAPRVAAANAAATW